MIGRLLRLLLPAPRRRATVDHLHAQVAAVRAREDAEGEASTPVTYRPFPDREDDWRAEWLAAPEADRLCLRCRARCCWGFCSRCGGRTSPRRVPTDHVPTPAQPVRRGRL